MSKKIGPHTPPFPVSQPLPIRNEPKFSFLWALVISCNKCVFYSKLFANQCCIQTCDRGHSAPLTQQISCLWCGVSFFPPHFCVFFFLVPKAAFKLNLTEHAQVSTWKLALPLLRAEACDNKSVPLESDKNRRSVFMSQKF